MASRRPVTTIRDVTVIAADPYAAAAPADVQLRLAAAERALVEHAYKKALDELEGLRISRADGTELALRAAALEGAALRELGRLDEAVETLEVAHTFADDEGAPAGERAAVLYELGATRLAAGAVAEACSLLTLALDYGNRSADPSDRLRATPGAARPADAVAACYRWLGKVLAVLTDGAFKAKGRAPSSKDTTIKTAPSV